MTTRSQKRKAIAELASGDFEASLTENNSTENLIPSSSKNPRLELENLEEIKTTLRKEIMTDLTKILAENQKEMLKLIAPASKKRSVNPNLQDSDSDQENISVARTSTPVKTQTATSSKTTPNNSRNNVQSMKLNQFWTASELNWAERTSLYSADYKSFLKSSFSSFLKSSFGKPVLEFCGRFCVRSFDRISLNQSYWIFLKKQNKASSNQTFRNVL